MKNICSIEDCNKTVIARDLCRTHYMRWNRIGDPLKLTKRPYGKGCPTDGGYWRIQVNGKSIREHVHIAEVVLGRKLSNENIVHHIDENRTNNRKDNLLICENDAYHNLIHKRMRALKISGNASFEKCWMCKTYDDPKKMKNDKANMSFYHAICKRDYDRERHLKKKGVLL